MLVRFTDNLGSNDAAPLGLDFSKCGKGATLDVSEAVGAALLRKRLAVEVEPPKTIKAVPPPPAIAAETKPESKPAAARVNQPQK